MVQLLIALLLTVSRLLICVGVAGLLVLYLVKVIYAQKPTLERVQQQQLDCLQQLQRLAPEH
jgi:hypothetical protein